MLSFSYQELETRHVTRKTKTKKKKKKKEKKEAWMETQPNETGSFKKQVFGIQQN